MTFRSIGNVLAITVIAVFLCLSFVRNYDFKTFESILSATGDDWGTYARYALDIKTNGILMPSTDSPYCSPSGFLYNYFIAFFLVVFGLKSLPIFVAQHVMLGLSVALIYWTFRDKMRGLTSLIFLFTLFMFALKDVYKNYSQLLLSENLALFTVSFFFFCFIKGFEKDNLLLQLSAAVLMGLSILTRPNLFIYGVILIPVTASYYFRKGRAGFGKFLVFLLLLAASASLLGARNYVLLKEPFFLPTNMSSISGIKHFHPIPASVDLSGVETNLLYARMHLDKDIAGYVEYILQEPHAFFAFYFKKILFCLGYLPALSSAYAMRLRWALVWAGYFIYLFLHVKDRRRWELWEVAVHLYLLFFYGSLIMLTYIHNYGFRMLLPGIFFVPVFAFIALDRLAERLPGVHKG